MGIENRPEEMRATHMDEFLKIMVVENFKTAIGYAIQGRDIECFKAYKSLFHLIECYEFNLKDKLSEITEAITSYIHELRGNPLNKAAMIKVAKKEMHFKDLLQLYMSEIPKSYAELGLWFKIVPHHNDIDKKISGEIFNSDFTAIKERKEVLLKLDAKTLISLMRPSHIHECYTKLRIQNVI